MLKLFLLALLSSYIVTVSGGVEEWLADPDVGE